MPEFNLVKQAQRSPTSCFFCGGHEGPFIDTYMDEKELRSVYVCAPNEKRTGCAGQMALKIGYLPPDEVAKLKEEIDQLLARQLVFENTTYTITGGQLLAGVGTGNAATSAPVVSTLRWLGKDD